MVTIILAPPLMGKSTAAEKMFHLSESLDAKTLDDRYPGVIDLDLPVLAASFPTFTLEELVDMAVHQAVKCKNPNGQLILMNDYVQAVLALDRFGTSIFKMLMVLPEFGQAEWQRRFEARGFAGTKNDFIRDLGKITSEWEKFGMQHNIPIVRQFSVSDLINSVTTKYALELAAYVKPN